MSRHKTNLRTGQGVKTSAFTLIELLVVIAIVTVLIAVLLPSLAAARETAKAVKCQASTKQWGYAWITYANDWKGVIPGRYYYWTRNNAFPTYLGANTKAQAAKLVQCTANPFTADSWSQQESYWCDTFVFTNNILYPSEGFWACETPVNNGISYTISVTVVQTPNMWFGHPNSTATNLHWDLHTQMVKLEEVPVTNDTGGFRYPGYTKYWRCYRNNLISPSYPFTGSGSQPWF